MVSAPEAAQAKGGERGPQQLQKPLPAGWGPNVLLCRLFPEASALSTKGSRDGGVGHNLEPHCL